MRRGRRIIICLCVIALLFAAYAVLARPGPEVEDSAASLDISTFEADQVAWIYYEHKGLGHEFRRDDGLNWVYANDPGFPVNPRYIREMSRRIEGLRSSRRLGDIDDDRHRDLGFDRPTLYVRAASYGGQEISYTVGSYNDVISHYYMVVNGLPMIHIVEQGFVDAFTLDLYDMILMDSPPAFYTSAVTGFEIIKDGARVRFDYYKDGKPGAYSALQQWFISDGRVEGYAAGSSYVLNLLAYTGAGMELEACALYGATASDLPAYGLDAPAIVSVDYVDDGGGRANIRYYIGDKVGERYYLMYSGSDMVYLVSALIAETLLETDPRAYRSAAISLVKLETVERLTLSSGQERYVFDIGHGEYTERDGTVKTRPVYSVNGAEVPADKMVEFYGQFYYADAEIVLPGNAQSGAAPYLVIEFERNTEHFPRMTLEFLPYDASFYLVRFNERSDQLMGIRKVEGILKSARALAGGVA